MRFLSFRSDSGLALTNTHWFSGLTMGNNRINFELEWLLQVKSQR